MVCACVLTVYLYMYVYICIGSALCIHVGSACDVSDGGDVSHCYHGYVI